MTPVEYLALSSTLHLNPRAMAHLMRASGSLSELFSRAVQSPSAVWQDVGGSTYMTLAWPTALNLETEKTVEVSSPKQAVPPDMRDIVRGVDLDALAVLIGKAKVLLLHNALAEFIALHNGFTAVLNPIIIKQTIERLSRE